MSEKTDSTNLKHTRLVAKFVVGSCVGFTVARVLSSNAPAKKRRHKAEVYVGSAVAGYMAADLAEDWTDRKIDELVEAWAEIKAQLSQAV